MKTTLTLLAVLTAGCVQMPDVVPRDHTGKPGLPFKEYIAPDGTRSWLYFFADAQAEFRQGYTDEELIAQRMAYTGFCENGYAIDRVETREDGRIYYGSCR